MGTIIKSISFQNFYNYYGNYDENTYHFKEELTLSMPITIWVNQNSIMEFFGY